MRAPIKQAQKKTSAARRLFHFIDKNKLVFSLDTRYRGVLDFGYKVAPVLGIAPNRTREGAEPEKVAASIWVFSEKRVYASLLIPNSATAERK